MGGGGNAGSGHPIKVERKSDDEREEPPLLQQKPDRRIPEVTADDILDAALLSAAKVHGVGFPSHLRTAAWIEHFSDTIPDVDTEKGLDKVKFTWRRLSVALGQLHASGKAATTGLKKHLDKKGMDKARDEKRAKDRADKEALQLEKQVLGDRARKLSVTTPQLPAFYTLEKTLFCELGRIQIEDSDGILPRDFDPDMSGLFRPSALLDEWMSKAIMQKVLTGFGGQYKRIKGFKEDGKVSNTLSVKQGMLGSIVLWLCLLRVCVCVG